MKEKEEILEEGGVLWEERKRDPRRKEKERIDQRKGGSGVISQKRKESLIKEDIGRRREEGLWGGGRGFRGSRSSRLLGLVFCLIMLMICGFSLRIGSVSDDDGFWKKGEEMCFKIILMWDL